jgi:hypothetical protein
MTKSKAAAKHPAVSDEGLAQAIRDKAAELNALVGQLRGRDIQVHLGVRTRYDGRETEPMPELVPQFRRFQEL